MAKKEWKSDKFRKSEPTTYQSHMADGITYGRQAERARKSDPADAFELYHMSIDAFRDALSEKPDDKKALERISRYSAQLDEIPKPGRSDGGPRLETTLMSVTLAASFIFGVDLLSHNITGSAIASGNTPVDMGAGALLLLASIAGIYFLINSKAPKPMPHPEKKKKKSKKK